MAADAEKARADGLQAKYDALTGEGFSDRCHAALRDRLKRAEAEGVRLKSEHDDEIKEFNAGYEAAKAGVAYEDEPPGTKYDVWRVGWAWFAFDKTLKTVANKLCGAVTAVGEGQ